MTTRLTRLGLLALLLPTLAAAQEPPREPRKPVQLGARLGMGEPGGEYGYYGGAMATDQDQSLVVTAEGSIAVADGLTVGAFGTLMRPRYDTNDVLNAHPSVWLAGSTYRLEASILGLQLGARAELSLGRTSLAGFPIAPWGALVAGWERLSLSYDATRTSGTGPASLSPTRTWSGLFGGLEAGVELVASPSFSVGPYLSFLMGKFSTLTVEGTGVTPTPTSTSTWADRTVDIDSSYRAVHVWSVVGLRGRLGL